MRRQNNSLQSAPAVLLDSAPPKDLDLSPQQPSIPISYITFGTFSWILVVNHWPVLFPNHYEEGGPRQKCLSSVISFRDFFHYHIKSTKAFLHTRMRSKVSHFLKMLNRSKSDDSGI
jgi:actin related protein 2/3 complex subunit 2